jgi:hypothetical protein
MVAIQFSLLGFSSVMGWRNTVLASAKRLALRIFHARFVPKKTDFSQFSLPPPFAPDTAKETFKGTQTSGKPLKMPFAA